VLLVEQLVEKALAVANRVYAMSQGKIVLESTANSENLGEQLERAYSVPDVIYPETLSAYANLRYSGRRFAVPEEGGGFEGPR
jgi:ABC-type cobalamin/Fe3+-siderophores transport system ATPase subunit